MTSANFHSKGEIIVVDDDPMICQAVTATLAPHGYQVVGFADGDSFLEVARRRTPVCVLLELCLPGSSGLDILKEAKSSNFVAPILMISARGSIPIAVEALKNGAVDFVQKPFTPEVLLDAVQRAIEDCSPQQKEQLVAKIRARQFPGHELLTPRQIEVLLQIVLGASSKEAARKLGLSFRTVETHRAHIMGKLHAKNSVDLIRIVTQPRRS
jgi:two-component system response regulator FixJ